MFNLEEMYLMQTALNNKILDQHHLNEKNLFEERILALLVEVGELANETRCFKYWSLKGPSEKEVILEEFVDGVHFILSLGLDLQVDQNRQIETYISDSTTVTQRMNDIFKAILIFRKEQSIPSYYTLIDMYFSLGQELGFTKEDIYEAYILKNKINHERQENHY